MRPYVETFFSLIFPLQLHFSTVLVIFLTFQTWNGANGRYYYENCSNSWISCGNITNIGYPFWGDDWGRPKYCGHPAMKLECPKGGNSDHKYPILKLGGSEKSPSFPVLAIRNSKITIPLIDLDSPHCFTPSLSDNSITDLDHQNWVTYSSSVSNIALFYECDRKRITVGQSDTIAVCGSNNDPAYYLPSSLSDSRFCKKQTGFLVLKTEFDDYKQGIQTLQDVLRKGFDVDFLGSYSDLCIRCQYSGGECGSSEPDSSQFVCFCKNRKYPDHCPVSIATELTMVFAVALPVGLSVLAVLIIGILSCKNGKLHAIFWKGRTPENQNAEAFLRICGSLAQKRYSYSSIHQITNSFEDKLGEGGYATVYKGKLSDGRFVAVKLFKQLKGNGEDYVNEVASIGRTNHVNIVSLLGFCIEGKERALIYEFMPNGSLEKFIFRSGNINCSLPCEVVFNIAQGVARGLEYLHQGCNERILHFDIKPHNILLDENFHPKISDFGLARLSAQQESSILLLEARGTIGYIAPEVFCRGFGSVSHKSDVYSYGMMVVDLVCGRDNTSANVQCSSEIYFPHWIYKQLELQGEVRLDEGDFLHRKMILVSLWCIQMDPLKRPSMSQVVEMLNGELEAITMPPQPFTSSPLVIVSFPSSETS